MGLCLIYAVYVAYEGVFVFVQRSREEVPPPGEVTNVQ